VALEDPLTARNAWQEEVGAEEAATMGVVAAMVRPMQSRKHITS
jgi:hypothetical protein